MNADQEKPVHGYTQMEMFQHDSATMFRFALEGDLTGDGVQELEHAWTTARSILRDKSADGRNFWNLECVKNCDDHGLFSSHCVEPSQSRGSADRYSNWSRANASGRGSRRAFPAECAAGSEFQCGSADQWQIHDGSQQDRMAGLYRHLPHRCSRTGRDSGWNSHDTIERRLDRGIGG